MFVLSEKGTGLNMGNLHYHQSVVERHIILIMKISYLKYLDDVDTLDISGVHGGKEIIQVKGGVEVTTVITYKPPFVVNGKTVTVSLAFGEGVA